MFSLRALLFAAVAVLALFAAAPARAGIPTGTISDLQTCQAYAQELQAGTIPQNACNADTLATIRRCLAQGVQFGVVTQPQADSLIANLVAYCANLYPG